MKRLMRATLLSVGLWALCSGQAFAQLGYYSQPQINPRPVVSPYLNLLNGANPATTYFGIIRPQMEMGQNIQGIHQQIQGIQGIQDNNMNNFSQLGFGMQQQLPDNAMTTGHPAVFQNFSFYYPMLNRNGMGNGQMNNGGNRPGVFSNNTRR